MKILITGANGLLGQQLTKYLLDAGHHVVATGRGDTRLPFAESEQYNYKAADITDLFRLQDIIAAEKPAVIVHAAAMTQVDACEQQPAICEAVNVMGTANLVQLAEAWQSRLIFVSTDFVFDGEKGNYKEEDTPNPVNWYGVTKMRAENLVRHATVPWAIVRTCLVYGNVLKGNRSNIITWVRENLEKHQPVHVVADQWRTPTYVEDLANGILLIIEQQATGIFHISGKDWLTPYEMARHTAAVLQLDTSYIKKTDASVFSQPARRPPKTGFDITKAVTVLGYRPLSFEEGIQRMFG